MKDNIYHRTCNQLRDYLISEGICIESVGRCYVGFKNYYNLQFNIAEEDYNLETSENILNIGKLLGVENIGLVDFDEFKGRIHEVYIIDEEELNEKYLDNGDLIFK